MNRHLLNENEDQKVDHFLQKERNFELESLKNLLRTTTQFLTYQKNQI